MCEMMPHTLILDFGGVTFMDSSGVGLIMGRYTHLQSFGGEVTVINSLGGNVIVNVKDTRVAISEEMARKIMV